MLPGVTLVAQWQRIEVDFRGEVDVLRGFSGLRVGTHGLVRCNGAKVL